MFYDCASVPLSAFVRDNGRDAPVDLKETINDLSRSKQWFRFALIDIGISEPSLDYDVLLSVVREVMSGGFYPRVVTTGQHFTDAKETSRQLSEITKLGVSRIILNLNQTTAEQFSDACLINYVAGCISSSIISECRFEFTDRVPEIFFSLSKRMETLRFYTKLYPVRARPTKQIQFMSQQDRSAFGTKPLRVVLSSTGDVHLRRREAEVVDIWVGHLAHMRLVDIISPSRLGFSA